MGERSKRYIFDDEPLKMDVRRLPRLKQEILKHIGGIFNEENKNYMPQMDGINFSAIISKHIDEELKWIEETKDPIALHYLIQEYHLPDGMEWEMYEKIHSELFWDGFAIGSKQIPFAELANLCNEKQVFKEPVYKDDFIDILVFAGETRIPMQVNAIPDIAIVMDSLKVFGYICSNWAEVAGYNKTFISKKGTPISAESYRTALHQWHEYQRKYRHDKEPNSAYIRLKELDEALTNILR